ncbi:MAG TPA: ribosome biogenesis GTP-binding protein YihA/YsxC [Candidatus Gemmiger avistercoris]|uniref:Probable GTP-binding protein EngB n=1 Tax=Candidatus Gemmiger avistercoris TaxID=2838606 RepID=A0A9D2JPN8_9FIRM|nr:ribosome biogenesis GTP-binding protein YihA/YsxC [uncultured Subdoligranulum sp.]HIZ61314.1 ribosome biogenesis GTP-binding protein YihA/YsxC [Candidatus Gemmiger avistercoris]
MNWNNCEFLASYGLSRQLPVSDRPEIVFSGRSNVGKSSLINKLCSRKNLARVSSTPGKTATINFYRMDRAYLVDLPGYGYAKVSNADRARWDELINSYFEEDRALHLLVQLLDCRHAPSADDVQMLEYLRYHNIPFVAALTKADKLKKSQKAACKAEFEQVCAPYGCRAVFLTSAEKGDGVEALRLCLERYLSGEPGDGV